MKILTKRAIALCIDASLFGCLFVFCQKLLAQWVTVNTGWIVLLCVPLFFKDLVFRNASIWKKIMRICVLDNKWQNPRMTTMIKRTACMLTYGYVLFLKARFVEGQMLSLFDWERDALQTRVIDKAVLKQLRVEANAMSGSYEANMTQVYNEYLRRIYAT